MRGWDKPTSMKSRMLCAGFVLSAVADTTVLVTTKTKVTSPDDNKVPNSSSGLGSDVAEPHSGQ